MDNIKQRLTELHTNPSAEEIARRAIFELVYGQMYQMLEYLDAHRLHFVTGADGRRLFTIHELIAADAAGGLI